ncbi:hypothetical protein B0H14DRAFT_2684987 [Mycena olivaceomarginata]|nr:hypothetical protein B0H14DRAFT_2684987 [Mycena olivaceomarginata]
MASVEQAAALLLPLLHRLPPSEPSNPFTNYSTAKSGYDDPDAERLAAEVLSGAEVVQ